MRSRSTVWVSIPSESPRYSTEGRSPCGGGTSEGDVLAGDRGSFLDLAGADSSEGRAAPVAVPPGRGAAAAGGSNPSGGSAGSGSSPQPVIHTSAHATSAPTVAGKRLGLTAGRSPRTEQE
ncbi:hypothetical protein GCM10018773_26630 [Streptomyces candidus]|nr:hypothetical protein GCM10018773_26630 [Streptomyces candidus]